VIGWALLAACLLAGRADATDYYACDCRAGAEAGCVPGDDRNAGTSPATAFRSYDRLQDAVAGSQCGDTFNFCMGGRFVIEGPTNWSTGRDCSANRQTIGSYQPRSFARDPVISGSGSSTAFAFSSGAGSTLEDVDVLCSGSCTNGVGVGVINIDADAVTVQRVLVDGFDVCMQIGTGREDVTVRGSTIRDCITFGLIGQAGDDTLVANNVFENNGCLEPGANCAFSRALYFNMLSGVDTLRDVTVRGNTFVDNTVDADDGRCNGNQVSLRGGRVVVTDNQWITPTSPPAGPGCIPIRMGAISEPFQVCTDCVFARNRIVGSRTGMELESWTRGVVENNLIWIPEDRTGTAYNSGIRHIASPVGGPRSQNPIIRNNSIVVGSSGASSRAVGIELRPNAGVSSVYSNAIRMLGSAGRDVCLSFLSRASLIDVREDHTICHRVNPNAAWAEYGSGDRTLTQYRADSPNGDRSREADPGFVNPPSDFRLSTSAAAGDAGHPTLSSSNDYERRARPAGPGFDVGAHERGAASPPP
jgi:hypothetical protein